MLSRKDIIFPGIVLILFASITIFFLLTYGQDFFKYRKFKNNGVSVPAVVSAKQEIQNFKLTNLFTDYRPVIYQVVASYNAGGTIQKCKLPVAKSTYDVFGIRDEFEIVYLPSQPDNCTLPASLDINYFILLTVFGSGFIFLLITLGFAFYIYRSFKRPASDKPVSMTTQLDLTELNCPKCSKKMTEGYLPTTGGVSWRDRGDPVGMPTILSGLPGTTFWVKRPRLHAFHCEQCKIIIFKYGKS